ncbi:hypothetical protein Sliba_15850 [Streptomyces nigrescens]|uniref:Uncharacterized protein n=1 Tax=Streptomyces nigrescens TaxID=1920 RepID=A0A640TDP1_STRNI|nr:hypothetical protein Sliba_15850 [Streptomyces libani subsp. libani]GGW03080.1 hypothetical protein GCM10010500_62180 [Streptomyces libani subsp. libani]
MDTFTARLDGAWEWWSAAIEEAQEGRWIRDPVERQVVADIMAATNALHGGRLAPFTEDSWHVRIGRIANWAGVLRLAARAGGGNSSLSSGAVGSILRVWPNCCPASTRSASRARSG